MEGSASGSGHRVGYGPLAAVVVTILIFLGAQVFVGLLISVLPGVYGWSVGQTNTWLETTFGQFVTVFAVEVVMIGLLWWFMVSRKTSWTAIGLKAPKLGDVGYAVGGYVTYFALFLLISQVARALVPSLDFEQKQEIGFDTTVVGIELWLVFISLVLLPPLVEEIICRGFLYTGLRTKLTKLSAAIITSVLFAVAHLQWGSGNALLWVAALDTFVLSLILVYLREKTDSLAAPMMVHMMKNGLAFTLLFVLKVA